MYHLHTTDKEKPLESDGDVGTQIVVISILSKSSLLSILKSYITHKNAVIYFKILASVDNP